MVLISCLVAGGVAITSGAWAWYQKQKTLREQERTKQTYEETRQKEITLDMAKAPSANESLLAGITPTTLDDWALLLKRGLPYLLVIVGLVIFLSYRKK